MLRVLCNEECVSLPDSWIWGFFTDTPDARLDRISQAASLSFRVSNASGFSSSSLLPAATLHSASFRTFQQNSDNASDFCCWSKACKIHSLPLSHTHVAVMLLPSEPMSVGEPMVLSLQWPLAVLCYCCGQRCRRGGSQQVLR